MKSIKQIKNFKVNVSKINNEEKLCNQIQRIIDYMLEKYNRVANEAYLHSIGADLAYDKVTLTITYTALKAPISQILIN